MDKDIVNKIHETLKDKGLKLALAESCTAGLLSHTITSIPGASAFLEGAIVAYSADSKKDLLGIGGAVEKHGTVSEETAREMAEAARKKLGVDVAVATTGVLGPDPVEEMKPGLVFISVSTDIETTSRGFKFEGSREEVKLAAVEKAMHMLYEQVSLWK